MPACAATGHSVIDAKRIKTMKSADFNGDGQVDWADMLEFVNSGTFGTMEGDERYDAKYDLNEDGKIDVLDFDMLQKLIPRPGSAPFQAKAEVQEPPETGAPPSSPSSVY